MSSEPTPVSSELRRLEQVHQALGSAHKLEDFYAIVAGLLVSPDTFKFSRAFIFRYDEGRQQFTGRMALGARTEAEHARFRKDQHLEQEKLQAQIAEIERESPEPAAVQHLYDLQSHALWVQLIQGREEGTGLNSRFQQIELMAADLPENHILNLAALSPQARMYEHEESTAAGLEQYLALPAAAARLTTRQGIHGIIVVDRKFERDPVDQYAIVRFQSLVNHAAITLENVEILEDMTAVAERMREVDRLKSNFLSIVSHELRTPLTSIIGFLHLLRGGRSGDLNEAQQDLVGRVLNHSSHLQNMVNDILEIAEVEAGGMVDAERTAVDPLGALWNVIPKMELRRSSRQVTIEPIIHARIPDIYADPIALERIYYHLLDNAIKFIPESGKVTISFDPTPTHLNISIADTGIGIPPENLKQIFDQFYQVDYRLQRSYGGLGIGLSIIRLLLNATHGTLNIESTPGRGSCFTVTYPLVKPGQ